MAFRRAEIEVVILDGADRCSGMRLTAATPRRSRSGATCQQGIYQTDITVESDTEDFLRLDPDPTSRILSIRSEPAGAGFRHQLTVQWKLSRTEWDFRFRPCPDPGRGPALLCSNVACRVFAEGEPLPPPERPVCAVSLDEGRIALTPGALRRPTPRAGSGSREHSPSSTHRMAFQQDLEGMNYALTGAPGAPGLR